MSIEITITRERRVVLTEKAYWLTVGHLRAFVKAADEHGAPDDASAKTYQFGGFPGHRHIVVAAEWGEKV